MYVILGCRVLNCALLFISQILPHRRRVYTDTSNLSSEILNYIIHKDWHNIILTGKISEWGVGDAGEGDKVEFITP